MLSKIYLKGINTDFVDESWPQEIKAITYKKNGENVIRYICTYNDGKKFKPTIFSLLEKHGQPELRKTWDLHHIVEGQHYADIDFLGQIEFVYRDQLPCVLIANEEHHALNSLLHCKQTDILFRSNTLPSDIIERSKKTMEECKNPQNKMELVNRIKKLSNLYLSAYTGRPVLQAISQNVFTEAQKILHLLLR